MKKEWVSSIRDQCKDYGIPFFFKQWGGVRKTKRGRELDGRTYDEYPRRVEAAVPERSCCAAFAAAFLARVQNLVRPQLINPVG